MLLHSSNPKLLEVAAEQAQDWFQENEIHQGASSIVIKKNAWDNYSSLEQHSIKTYFNGFVDGFGIALPLLED